MHDVMHASSETTVPGTLFSFSASIDSFAEAFAIIGYGPADDDLREPGYTAALAMHIPMN